MEARSYDRSNEKRDSTAGIVRNVENSSWMIIWREGVARRWPVSGGSVEQFFWGDHSGGERFNYNMDIRRQADNKFTYTAPRLSERD